MQDGLKARLSYIAAIMIAQNEWLPILNGNNELHCTAGQPQLHMQKQAAFAPRTSFALRSRGPIAHSVQRHQENRLLVEP